MHDTPTVCTHTHRYTQRRKNSLYKLGNTFVDTRPKKFRNWRGCSTVSSAFHKIMDDRKILFPEGTDSVVHKPLPHVSLTSHWHGPKRFVHPQPRIISVIYNVRCSVEKKLATLMRGTLVYTKHVRLFLFLFCRWRVVGCFFVNFWHIALFLSFFSFNYSFTAAFACADGFA